MLRTVSIITLLIAITVNAFAQNTLVFEKSVPTDQNKAKKFSRDFMLWTEKQSVIEIVFSNKTDSIAAKGKFAFENKVAYPGSATISRTYTGQTNGYITYKVAFVCREDQYIIRLYDLEHKPTGQGDVISFGKVTNADNPPDYLMMDYDTEWCNNVWKFIKEQCQTNSSSFFLQLQNEMANK